MKQSGVSALCLILFIAGFGPAVAGDSGAYVSVKAVFGHTVMSKTRADGHWELGPMSRNFSFGSGSEKDQVFGGAAALGYDFFTKFCVPIRAEAEYSLFSQASDSSRLAQENPIIPWRDDEVSQKLKVSAQTLFLNAYYDFRNRSRFTPYVGVGAGLSLVKAKGSATYFNRVAGPDTAYLEASSRTRTNFAYNLTAGLSVALTKSVSLDLSYRFADLGKAEAKRSDFPTTFIGRGHYTNRARHVYMHQAMAGLRFSF